MSSQARPAAAAWLDLGFDGMGTGMGHGQTVTIFRTAGLEHRRVEPRDPRIGALERYYHLFDRAKSTTEARQR